MRESKEGGGRHRWRWILLGAIVALLLLIVLLPTLLSTGPGRRLLVGVANARMDGSVAMESCSLGWLSGFKFRGLKVSDKKGAELASVDALSISASVPQLLGSIKKLGTVQVEGPRVTVDLSEPEGPTPSGEEEPRAQEEAERLPFDLTGTVKVTGGWITVKDGQAQLLDLKNLSGEAGIEGLSRPIEYSVQGDVADGGGRFTAKGSVRVAKDGKPGAEALKGNVEAALKRLDLSRLEPFIQRAGLSLTARGLLDADLTADFEGPRDAVASGTVSASSLVLGGDLLHGDNPAIERADLRFDVGLRQDRIELNELKLDSPLARADVSGALPAGLAALKSDVRLDGSVTLMLPQIARQFRNILRLREGLTIEQGRLLGDFRLSREESGVGLETGLEVVDLAATQDGRRIAPAAPVSVRLKAGVGMAGPRVESLKVNSSFATAEASGTLQEFTMVLSADLAVASTEVSKFLDFPSDALSGRADLNVRVETSDRDRHLTADATLDALKVQVAPDKVLREESSTFRFEARADAALEVPRTLRDVSAHLESSHGTADLKADRITMGETPVTAEARGATASIEADLTRIWESARALDIGPPDTTLAGTVTGDLRGALADGVLDLPSLKLTSRNLRVQQGGRKLSQESVELSGALQADLSERRLSITGARVAAPAGHLDLPDLTVPDWRSPATGTAASFSAKVNLERLYADAGGLVTMPDDLSVAGELSLSGNIGAAEQGAAGRKVTANAHLTDLNMSGSEGGLLREESIEMAFETIANPPVEGQALRLKDISLAAVGGPLPAELTASEVALGEAVEQSRIADLSLTSQASLAPLLDISRRFGAVPHDLTGSGALDLTCAGSLDGGVLEVKQFDFTGRDLQVARGEKTFREPELRLSGTGRADLKKRSARLESATLDSSVGSAGATGVVVPDWSRLPQGVAGEVTGGAELARVLEAARPFAELPEGMQAEGTLDLASAFSVDREGVNADGRLSVRPLKVRKGRSPWFTEDSIELSADARIPHGRETVNFESLRVSSEPGMLRAEASGRLEDWSDARHLVLEGTATPDWSRIGALVKAFTGKDIEMEGAEKRPFKVDTRLGEADPAEMLRQTTADAGLQVRRFRYAGVEAQDVELKVETAGEQLDLGATGQLNQGPFTFGPVLRVAEGEPALVLPEPGVVLSGAQITDEAANALLGRALPIFRNPVDVEGVADLAFREFNVPLTGDLQRAVVDAQITLRGASVASSGVLKSLLGLVGLDDETLQVPDQDVRVRLRDGRIHHGKMPLRIREHTVVSSGSVGLDKTLDLLVELPVTRELVDSDSLYGILEGQSIKVRLRGTLDNPQFDRDIIKDNLRDLIRGSAGGLLRRLLE